VHATATVKSSANVDTRASALPLPIHNFVRLWLFKREVWLVPRSD